MKYDEEDRVKRVFIAGPMSTSGEPGPNLHAAASAAADLLLAGYAPFIPHVTWVLHAIRPDVSLHLWHEWDLVWLERCDAVLRLPGESVGADKECGLAGALGIPVYYEIESLRGAFEVDAE